MFKRSAFRFTILLCGLFVVVLFCAGLWVDSMLRTEVQQEIDRDLTDSYLGLLAEDLDSDDVEDWLSDLDEDGLGYGFAYRDDNGRIYGRVQREIFKERGLRTYSAVELFQRKYLSGFGNLDDDLHRFDDKDDHWRVYAGPFEGGVVVFIEPLDGIEAALSVVPITLGIVGGVLIIVTLAAGALLAWRQQGRIDQISQGLQRIGHGDLELDIGPKVARDDLDKIMQDIDSAAGQLNASVSQMRLFSQNVAHELNTPLARLRASLEDLESSQQSQTALEQTDAIIKTLAGIQRIARLSKRADVSAFNDIQMEQLAELMDELYSDVAADNGQYLRIECEDRAMVHGDFQLIAQMVSNLIENAIRHAGEGAQIDVQFSDKSVQIQDSGKGISDAMKAEIFKPLQGDLGAGGTGLGLALVEAIAKYHEAKISLIDGAGFGIKISFPR